MEEVSTYIDNTGDLKIYQNGMYLRANLTVKEMLTLYQMLKDVLQGMDEIPQDAPRRSHEWLNQALNEGDGTYHP